MAVPTKSSGSCRVRRAMPSRRAPIKVPTALQHRTVTSTSSAIAALPPQPAEHAVRRVRPRTVADHPERGADLRADGRDVGDLLRLELPGQELRDDRLHLGDGDAVRVETAVHERELDGALRGPALHSRRALEHLL